MADKYPKSKGGAWINKNRETDKHPHLKGHIVVTPEQIRKLVEMAKAGMEPRLQLAVWKAESDTGVKWLSIHTEAYMQEERKPQPVPDFDDDPIPF